MGFELDGPPARRREERRHGRRKFYRLRSRQWLWQLKCQRRGFFLAHEGSGQASVSSQSPRMLPFSSPSPSSYFFFHFVRPTSSSKPASHPPPTQNPLLRYAFASLHSLNIRLLDHLAISRKKMLIFLFFSFSLASQI